MIEVLRSDPKSPPAATLLGQSHALMNAMFPAGACHYLDFDALSQPHIRFFTAHEGENVLGTGALAIFDGYGEVKSMFTAPKARGKGVAAHVLTRIEGEARRAGLRVLRLETGTGLDAAHRLYSRFGFARRGPFGNYSQSPYSLFYEKVL